MKHVPSAPGHHRPAYLINGHLGQFFTYPFAEQPRRHVQTTVNGMRYTAAESRVHLNDNWPTGGINKLQGDRPTPPWTGKDAFRKLNDRLVAMRLRYIDLAVADLEPLA